MNNYKGIKNIIFDLGVVILDIDFNRTVNAFKSYGIKDFENVFTRAAQADIFDSFERGELSPQEFRNGLREITGMDMTDELINKAWNDIIIGFPPENIKLLEKAKQNYCTCLLSNTNAIHFPVYNALLKPYGYNHISEMFDKIYLSHEVGMRKPEARIFELVISDNNLNPSDTLYIDDTYDYMPTAETLGLITFHLKDSIKLAELFNREGVLL